jgi:hypothetical protein
MCPNTRKEPKPAPFILTSACACCCCACAASVRRLCNSARQRRNVTPPDTPSELPVRVNISAKGHFFAVLCQLAAELRKIRLERFHLGQLYPRVGLLLHNEAPYREEADSRVPLFKPEVPGLAPAPAWLPGGGGRCTPPCWLAAAVKGCRAPPRLALARPPAPCWRAAKPPPVRGLGMWIRPPSAGSAGKVASAPLEVSGALLCCLPGLVPLWAPKPHQHQEVKDCYCCCSTVGGNQEPGDRTCLSWRMCLCCSSVLSCRASTSCKQAVSQVQLSAHAGR